METRNAESFYSETQFSEWLKHIGGQYFQMRGVF